MSDKNSKELISQELCSIRAKLLDLSYRTRNNCAVNKRICKIHNDLDDLILDDFTLGYKYMINKLTTEGSLDIDLIMGVYEHEIKRLNDRLSKIS